MANRNKQSNETSQLCFIFWNELNYLELVSEIYVQL